MASLLYRLGKTAFRRWPFFLAGWLIAMVAVGAVAATMSKPMSDSFSIPGIPSERAANLQSELFPGATDAFDQASVKVVVAAPRGETLAQHEPAVRALVSDLAGLPQMPDGGDPMQPAPSDPVASAAAQEKQFVATAEKSGGDVAAARANANALSPLSQDGRVGTITWNFDVKTVADV